MRVCELFNVLQFIVHLTNNLLILCYVYWIEQEHVLTITSQQQELDSKSHAITQSLKDKGSVESKAETMGGTLRALETEILNLRGERNAMQERLRSDGDSAKVLDEYKKRAQLALKKVGVGYHYTRSM